MYIYIMWKTSSYEHFHFETAFVGSCQGITKALMYRVINEAIFQRGNRQTTEPSYLERVK